MVYVVLFKREKKQKPPKIPGLPLVLSILKNSLFDCLSYNSANIGTYQEANLEIFYFRKPKLSNFTEDQWFIFIHLILQGLHRVVHHLLDDSGLKFELQIRLCTLFDKLK